jgi:uncharacterized protein YjiK
MTESVAAVSSTRPASRRRLGRLSIAFAMAVVALLVVAAASASAAVTEVNLAQYKRIHRYALPLPPGTPAPANSLLAEEASGVTYDPVTETLFVVGDGGTSVVQVDKEGNLINSMTLAPGSSPQGTTFYDTEGIAYVGNEEFVITEERESKLDRFKYVAGGELTRAAAKTVVIGTDNNNIGIEGVTNDPLNPGHMIAIKESGPERIYSTDINWEAQTATNFEGDEGELFPASDVGTLDFSDVYALANVAGISAAEESNLLVISQESGEVVNISRSGHVNSRLAELAEPADTISVPDMTNEGVTMDQNGMLYIVDEDGGGSQAHPQLWVYEPQTAADTAPTAVTLGNEVTSLPESTTGARVKVAGLTVTDPDGFGENNLSLTGPDASHFEVDHNGVYLKAGTLLNASTQAEYEVSVEVDDPAVGTNPDATSAPYKLTVTPNAGGTSGAQIAITEVAPWSSGDSPIAADWFELTNVGTTKVDMTGWRMNDNHASFASSDAIEGVTSLAPGHSAVFVNGTEAKANEFIADWYPSGAPTGFQIGWLPEGPGLSTSGDQVNIYDTTGAKVSGVEFGASPSAAPFGTFDNTAALGVGATVDPTLTTLSTVGTNEAFSADAGNEIGSPGTAPVSSPLAVTEAAPWGSSNVEYGADWFELTNESPVAISLSGWKMDDSSNAFGTAVVLNGVSSIAPGESVLFLETAVGKTAQEEGEVVTKFETSWFGSSVPAGLQVGTYHGSGVGLSTGGDAVNIFESEGNRITGVSFGAASTASPLPSFENTAGLGNYKAPVAITNLSVEGVNGAFVAHDQLGSPGATTEPVGPPPLPEVKVTEVDPNGSSAAYKTDWFELTNMGTTAVELTGWHSADSANSFAGGGALTGVTSLPAGASAVFLEDPTKTAEFEAAWFPGGVPSGFLIGGAAGTSGLSSSGDQVNIFEANEEKVTGVAFGATTIAATLDNAAGVGSAINPPPTISTASVAGTNGAFTNATSETGSPGTIKNAVGPPPLPEVKVTEVDPTGSSSGYAADWFELTNKGTGAVSLTGWKIDDNSDSFGSAVPLNGVASIPAGGSAVFVEGTTKVVGFESAWFPAGAPAGFLIGSYEGSGVGLSSGGDQVNIFDAAGETITGVNFGASTTGVSFDNSAGIGGTTNPPPTISTLSKAGFNGAFIDANAEIGSPGATTGSVGLLSANTPTFPVQPVGTIGSGQWVTVTNEGGAAATITSVKVIEGNEESAGDFILSADHCTGESVANGGTCKVQVRFAPGRENAASSASLVIASNAQNSPLKVSLTGTSSGLPAGPQGERGEQGESGEVGPSGPAGPVGPAGPAGPAGPEGPAGPAGPAGPEGPAGPAGKEGKEGKEGREGKPGKEGREGKEGKPGKEGREGKPGKEGKEGKEGKQGKEGKEGREGKQGKEGKQGPAGKDGVVSFTSTEYEPVVSRGQDAHLQFRLRNRTAGPLRGATVSAEALGVKGTVTLHVATIQAGDSRVLTLALPVGDHASLGRHRVQVQMQVGGHTVTDTVTAQVIR